MRRIHIGTLSLFIALLSVGCHFNFDRALSPGEIRGRLLLEDDTAKRRPATDAHVSIVGSAINVPTDSSGRFVFRGLPVGNYQLRVTRDLANTGKQTVILTLKDVQLEAVAGKPGARDLGDVVVAGLGSVHGTMTRNGEPVSGIRVVLRELTETVVTTGQFLLEALPAGTYPVFVVDEQGRTLKGAVGHDLSVDVKARQASNLTIELNDLVLAEDGNVAGRVFTIDGVIPSGAEVKLVDQNHNEIIATTNEQGIYSGMGPAGVYTLQASKTGYTNSYIEYFVVDGATAAPDMMLVGTGTRDLSCGPDPLDSTSSGCGLHARCDDSSGTRTCACVSGFTGDGFSCSDVDECATNNGGCDALTTCTNTAGSFTCGACPTGYTGTGSAGCEDINECLTSNGGCDAHATCANSPAGSFTCTCDAPYVGTGTTCELGDACLANHGGCDVHADCATVSQQAVCTCQSGWHGDGVTCQPNYSSITAGDTSTCALKTDGTLWCWGANASGQVGDGTLIDRLYAVQIDATHIFTAVGGGKDHACAIRADGTLWCWGTQYAEIAPGPARGRAVTTSTNGAHTVPQQIGNDTDWAQLALGATLSCGLKTTGALVCWTDTFSERSESPGFQTITGMWTSVSVGFDHACGLQSDGTLWCWGNNRSGQSGAAEGDDIIEPVAAGGGDHWVSVAAGYDHTCAVKSDNSLWCWGANFRNQLGASSEQTTTASSPLRVGMATTWSAVAAGDEFSCALRADKSIWCWGSDYAGELGDGPHEGSFPDPSQVAGQWSAVYAGGSHACGLKPDGTLWCWGDNVGGDLGNGNASTPNGPVQVVLFNSDFCATNNGGCVATAYCSQTPTGTSGDATHACTCNPGYEGNGASACTIIDLCTSESCDINATCTPVLNDVQCVCNQNFAGAGAPGTCEPVSCAVAPEGWCDAHAACADDQASGHAVCSCGPGYGGSGRSCVLTDPCQINHGECDAHASCTNENVTAICACEAGWTGDGHKCVADYQLVGTGYRNSCSIKTDGTLWCWGYNGEGQVGDGTTVERHYPTLVTTATDWAQVDAGGGYTCGVKTDGTLWCWGGQDNRGGPTRRGQQVITPIGVTAQLTPLQVGTDTSWTSISLGDFGACGIQTGGGLACVNFNSHLQTDSLEGGDGGTSNLPYTVSLVTGEQPWTAVAVGGSHTCGLQSDGTIWCWGYNWSGQLGTFEGYYSGTPVRIGAEGTWTSIASGGNHSCAVRDDSTLWCWGDNNNQQLGQPTQSQDGGGVYSSNTPLQVGTDTDWTKAAAGGAFTCALKSSGSLFCWGYDGQGQLGDGPNEASSPNPVTVPGTWTQLSAEESHACAIQANGGGLFCWGDNYAGDLGNGGDEATGLVSVYSFENDPCATNNGGCAENGFCTQYPPLGDSATATTTCECFSGYDGDGVEACTLIDLCSDGSGETPRSCDSNATCTPIPNDYTCACNDGFGGYPYYEGGCEPQSCAAAASVGWCDTNASCSDVEGVSCSCNLGFTGDGRSCSPSYLTVAAGFHQTCATKGDGTLWCWGWNEDGAVGDGSGVNRAFPSQVDKSQWISVSAAGDWGSETTCGVRADGTLWCWGGWNTGDGPPRWQTGNPPIINQRAQLSPVQVGTDATWTSISVGLFGACGLQTGGALVCFGVNAPSVSAPDGGYFPASQDPAPVTGANPWTQVSVGGSHVCGVQSDSSLWCWGWNDEGELGQESNGYVGAPTQVGTANDWTQVTTGNTHTCAVKADGTLWCWGSNYNGELGVAGAGADGGGISGSVSPVQVGTETSWASASAGNGFTCALRTDQSLWCWGQNYYGQLGPNAGQSQSSNPVVQSGSFLRFDAGEQHVCALRTDGALVCWGSNNYWQLGTDTVSGSTPYPSEVYNFPDDPCLTNNGGCDATAGICTQAVMHQDGPDYVATTCSCRSGYEGEGDTCTLIDYCAMGYAQYCAPEATCVPVPNDYECHCPAGFLGDGYAEGSACQPKDCATANAAGWCDANATCTDDGTQEGNVQCACNDGYLGDGRTCAAGFTSVQAGLNGTACGLKVDGTLWCWGNNNDGTVGDGSGVSRSYPSEITTATDWTSVSTGGSFTFATKSDGTLWWWGGPNHNEEGPSRRGFSFPEQLYPQLRPLQYGTDTSWTSVVTGGDFTCGLQTGGHLLCWNMNYQEEPSLVDDTRQWTAVATGESHVCAIQSDQSLWCWGSNNDGQAGAPGQQSYVEVPYNPAPESTWLSVSAGSNHTCGVKTDHTLWCWGSNSQQQLGIENSDGPSVVSVPTQLALDTDWAEVSAGSNHTCALKQNGTVWCWGYAYWGQLGDNVLYGPATYVPTEIGGEWKQVSAGGSFSCGLQGAQALCWGYGYDGRLGDGQNDTSALPRDVHNFQSDPCATNNGGCDVGSYCTNYPYQEQTCNCLSGYQGEGDSCRLIDYCVDYGYAQYCDPNATCTPVPNNYICACPAGYVGDGSIYGTGCVPQDCATAATLGWCDANASCTDDGEQNGNVSCGCNSGYIGDGRTCMPGYTDVVAGLSGTTCALKGDDSLWCWGYNDHGEVGDGSLADRYYPAQITTATNWTSVASNYTYTFATRADGTLWWWGGSRNIEGGPARGRDSVPTHDSRLLPQLTPLQFDTATDWKSVSVGGQVCALKANGSLWCWDAQNEGNPAAVISEVGWKSVSVGDSHVCAIQSDDTLWCWGYNADGQTGQATESVWIPSPALVDEGGAWQSVSAGSSHTCGIKTDGSLWCWGSNYHDESGVENYGGEGPTRITTPTQLGSSTTWKSVSTGWYSSCALQTDDSLWCWGIGQYGQLGHGYSENDTPDPQQVEGSWKHVSTGTYYACAVDSGSGLHCWGGGTNGQLGTGGAPEIAGVSETYNFASDPCVVDNGGCNAGAFCTHTPEETSCACLPGYTTNEDQTCTLIDYCVMYEGPCDSTATCTPVRGNYLCTCPADFVGDGYSEGGCFPKDCATAASLNWCDSNATCAESEGQTSCTCNAGFVGDGRSCLVAYTAVSSGDRSTCALKSDGTLWCFGSNGLGELGDGTGIDKAYPSQVGTASWNAMSVGTTAACGIQKNGTLWCWGGRDLRVVTEQSQQTTNQNNPMSSTHYSPVQVGVDANWASISVGDYGACAIDATGLLYCFDPIAPDLSTGIGGIQPWTQVSVGDNFICAVQADGSLWCWGYNDSAQAGQSIETSYIPSPAQVAPGTTWKSVAANAYHACAVASDNTMWCWGANYSGELGFNPNPTETYYVETPIQVGTESDWVSTGVGQGYSCGLRADQSLWCWGYNTSGIFANYLTYGYHYSPDQVYGSFKLFSSGPATMCAIDSGGTLYCWGRNSAGELGNGDSDTTTPYFTTVYNFDSDPCVTNNGGCALTGGACTHTPYDTTCSCLSGYSGSGQECQLINYCNSESCDSNATCTPIPNSVQCTCNAPLTGDGYYEGGCAPADCEAAAEAGWCDAHANCNVDGSVYCSCQPGWRGSGRAGTCIPTDCQTAAAVGWCSPNATCYADGTVYCQCNEGYEGDGTTCTDIDECAQGYCATNALCSNSPGSYSCQCRPGFEGDGYESCADTTDWAQWPMPDSQTSACTDGLGLARCPTSEEPLGDQDGVRFGRSNLMLNMDALGQDDPDTGLEWSLQVTKDVLADKSPGSVCDALPAAGGLAWRMPSITELLSITDYGEPGAKLDWAYTSGMPSGPLLSNTVSPVTGERLALDPDTGETSPISVDKTGTVVCVR